MDNTNKRRESLSFELSAEKRKRSKYLQCSPDNPVLWVAGVVLVYVLLVGIVGFNLGTNESSITQRDLGSIALQDYKAPYDFDYNRIDWDATERERRERESEVLPVFRWDANARAISIEKVVLAFEMMRERLSQQREKEILNRLPALIKMPQSKPLDEEIRGLALRTIFGGMEEQGVFDEALRAVSQADASSVADSMRLWADANKDDFTQVLGCAMSDGVYEWLYKQSFSKAVQAQFSSILDTILGRKIVASQRVLNGVKSIMLQWDEDGKIITKNYNDVDLSAITDMDSSLTMMRSMVDSSFREAPQGIFEVFVQFLKPNVVFDEASTNQERRKMSAQTPELRVRQTFQKGQTIVSNGDPITQEHVDIYVQLMQTQADSRGKVAHWLALAAIIAILLVLLWRPLRGDHWGRQRGARDVLYFAFNLVAIAFSLRIFAAIAATIESAWSLPYSLLLLFPFASGTMLIRLVINRQYAFLFAVASIVLTAIVGDGSVLLLSYAVVMSIAGALLLERPKSRTLILQRGFMIGVLGAVMAIASIILSPNEFTPGQLGIVGVLALSGGFISAATVTIGLPIAESVFGYATTTKLLELSNLDHPALKSLFMEAPGTYQHSMMVGSLNEAAAEAIGANAVLARIGGYYHDIGKIKNAQYFAENQRGDNPHNRLRPNMSALILKTHVKDGIELAKKHKLPQDIIDFIATHHGTSRIEYFYQRALQQEGSVREEDYRYPGPRPQSRETGICMVSDMVEAAVRSLPDKNPDKIKFLVHKLINHKFADGQFDECDLTLRDLNEIANAVLSILNAVYHTRPEYPEQRREREKAEEKKKLEAEKQQKEKKDKEELSVPSEKAEEPHKKHEEPVPKEEKQKKTDTDQEPKSEKAEEQKTKYDKVSKVETSSQKPQPEQSAEKRPQTKSNPKPEQPGASNSSNNSDVDLSLQTKPADETASTQHEKEESEIESSATPQQSDSASLNEAPEQGEALAMPEPVPQVEDPHVVDFEPNLNVFKKQ